jgi:hypothetical protein
LAAEKARLEDELKHKAELERLEREKIAEQDRKKAEFARIEKEKLEAEQRAENAAKAEREKIRLEQEARDAEIAQGEADTKHRGEINREAASCLVECGLSEDQAKKVVTAIVKGLIRNVKIIY